MLRFVWSDVEPIEIMGEPFPLIVPATGIDEIDVQHGQLLACLERLQTWADKGSSFAASLDALQNLNEYVVTHFSYEEALLHQHGYPKLQEHIEEHKSIVRELGLLTDKIYAGGDASKELLGMVTDWIVKHIGEEDIEYAQFFGTYGVDC